MEPTLIPTTTRGAPDRSHSLDLTSPNPSHVSTPKGYTSNSHNGSHKWNADQADKLVHDDYLNGEIQVYEPIRSVRTPTPEPILLDILPPLSTETIEETTSGLTSIMSDNDLSVTSRQAVDFGKSRALMDELSNDINEDMKCLFEEIYLSLNQTAEVDQAPHEDLHELLVNIFGVGYRTYCDKLRTSGLWTTSKALQAIVWAFLYKEIFPGKSQWHDRLCQQSGRLDNEVMVKLLFALLPGHNQQDTVQYLNATINQVVANEMQQSTSPGMQAHVEELSMNALQGLEPEFKRLAAIHRGYGAVNWAVTLRKTVSSAIIAASSIKLKLETEAFAHEFFWPEPGILYEEGTMHPEYRPPAGQHEKYVVAYSRRPGLGIQTCRHQEMKVAVRAEVVTQLAR